MTSSSLLRLSTCLFCLLAAEATGQTVAALVGAGSAFSAVAPELVRALAERGVEVAEVRRVDGGLRAPVRQDMAAAVREVVSLHRPALVVLWVSDGDTEALATVGQAAPVEWGTPAWRQEYTDRLRGAVAAAGAAQVVWVGPVASAHPNDHLRQALVAVFGYAALAPTAQAIFVDAFAVTTTPDGRCKLDEPGEKGTLRLRTGGGVGFTSAGAKWLAAALSYRIRQALERRPGSA
jgi:hypothetical protein